MRLKDLTNRLIVVYNTTLWASMFLYFPSKYMIRKLLVIIPLAVYFGSAQVHAMNAVLPAVTPSKEVAVQKTVLAERAMSMQDRYAVPIVGDVFRDNILLTLAYMSGKVQNASQINWDEVRKPQSFAFTLQPGQSFAYHDGVLPEYANSTVMTTKAHFNAAEGFLATAGLYGNGVCHFASLMNWAARDAGLEVAAPTNHDFAAIPGISREYGTAIYYVFGQQSVNELQNLYIRNNQDVPVTIIASYDGTSMKVRVEK